MRRVSTDRSVVYIAKGATDDEKPLTTAVCDSMKPQLRVFYRPVLRKKKKMMDLKSQAFYHCVCVYNVLLFDSKYIVICS